MPSSNNPILNKWWSNYMMSYGITRPQWVKGAEFNVFYPPANRICGRMFKQLKKHKTDGLVIIKTIFILHGKIHSFIARCWTVCKSPTETRPMYTIYNSGYKLRYLHTSYFCADIPPTSPKVLQWFLFPKNLPSDNVELMICDLFQIIYEPIIGTWNFLSPYSEDSNRS